MRIVMRAIFVAASFRDCFGAFHHEGVAEGAERENNYCIKPAQ